MFCFDFVDFPEQPQNLMTHSVTSRNLTLTWVEPHDNNAPISGYNVSYVQPVFLGGGTVVLNVSADSSVSSGSSQDIANSFLVQIFIDDLHPGATYNFTVIAFNIIGSSKPSVPYNQTMLDEGNVFLILILDLLSFFSLSLSSSFLYD